MWIWIKCHPQRVTALLLVVFTQIQGSLALADLHMPPLFSWALNTVFSIVMSVLAFGVKNLKDEGSEPPPAM